MAEGPEGRNAQPRIRKLRRPGEPSALSQMARTTSEFLNRAVLIGSALLAAHFMDVQRNEAERSLRPTIARPEKAPSEKPEVSVPEREKVIKSEAIRRLEDARARLQKAPLKDVEMFSQSTGWGRRCALMNKIMDSHANDIATVAVYVGLNPGDIPDERLRVELERMLREKFNLSGEDFNTNPQKVGDAFRHRIENRAAYIKRCTAIIVGIPFARAAKDFVHTYPRQLSAVLETVIIGNEKGRKDSVKVAEALDRIVSTLFGASY